MPEQAVNKVTDALAKRLRVIKGIQGVDEFVPDTIQSLPRIVLRYLDSPGVLSTGGRHEINHTIQIEAIVASKSISKKARRQASDFIQLMKIELFTKNGGLNLILSPNQTTIGPTYSQAVRNVVWNENIYFAGLVIIRCNEITGELL